MYSEFGVDTGDPSRLSMIYDGIDDTIKSLILQKVSSVSDKRLCIQKQNCCFISRNEFFCVFFSSKSNILRHLFIYFICLYKY